MEDSERGRETPEQRPQKVAGVCSNRQFEQRRRRAARLQESFDLISSRGGQIPTQKKKKKKKRRKPLLLAARRCEVWTERKRKEGEGEGDCTTSLNILKCCKQIRRCRKSLFCSTDGRERKKGVKKTQKEERSQSPGGEIKHTDAEKSKKKAKSN